MAQLQVQNRFSNLKKEFREDTGLEYTKENMALYIAYVNLRFNDVTNQYMQFLTQQLLTKIETLPQDIRLKLAEMIREHEVIKEFKQLLKK